MGLRSWVMGSAIGLGGLTVVVKRDGLMDGGSWLSLMDGGSWLWALP